MKPGTEFDIVSGPSCGAVGTWWQVRLDGGTTGWVEESFQEPDYIDYYIEPVPQPTPLPPPTSPPPVPTSVPEAPPANTSSDAPGEPNLIIVLVGAICAGGLYKIIDVVLGDFLQTSKGKKLRIPMALVLLVILGATAWVISGDPLSGVYTLAAGAGGTSVAALAGSRRGTA